MDNTVILYINRSESRCGACNGGADPYEESHITLLGWRAINDNMKGCGVKFTHASSDYYGITERVMEMRPDLIWVGFDEEARY